MALNKVTYEDNVTVIYAQNLNEIQDEVIRNAGDITDNREAIADLQASKQDVLIVDGTPTENSTNPVSSGGVYTALIPDTTLSYAGKAADAKATGDAVLEIKAQIAEEQELENRILYDVAEYIPTRWDAGGINPNTGELVPSNTTRIASNFIPINTNRRLDIDVNGSVKIKVAFYTGTSYTTYTGEVDADWTSNGTRVLINTGDRYYIRILAGYINDGDIVNPQDVTSNITIIRYALKEYVEQEEFDNSVYTDKEITIRNTVHKYWNTETALAVLTDVEASFYASDPIPVEPGEMYTLTAQQGNTDKTRIWCVTDNSYTIIAMCENLKGTETHTVTFTIPEGGTLLLLTKQASTSDQTLIRRLTALNLLVDKALNGRRLSLLGDSISAFTGTIPAGNDPYYTGSNAGVTSSDQMWWKILCDKTGMIPMVIDAWSGSSICYNYATDSTHSDTNKIPMSSNLRTGRLGDGNTSPDVIIIAGGTNDFTYSQQSTTPLGNWDGKTPINRADVLSGDSTFMETYANLISVLHTNYPKAIVVCLSLFFTNRGTSNGTTRVNDMNKLISDYNDSIERVCKIMGVPFIDVYNVGFNYENYYPTYASDSSSVPTHPNATGHRVIGAAVAEKIVPLVSAYLG